MWRCNVEKTIMKVVTVNKNGVLVWERDVMGQHSVHLRNYKNQVIYKKDISYFIKDRLKLNDIIPYNNNTIILDFTNKHGTGVLDVVCLDNENKVKSTCTRPREINRVLRL